MLKRILPRTRRFHCPDEYQLAAYVDQQLIGAERERVESHLAKCNSCLQQVGFLIKEFPVTLLAAPPSLLHSARQLATVRSGNAPFGWKWLTVAASIAVIAIGLAVWYEARTYNEQHSTIVATARRAPAPAIREDTNSAAETAVRSASPPESQPVVLSPQPGATVHDSDFIIRWEPVPNATAYEVRVVTADGDLVWRKRVNGNSVNAPRETLRPGFKYFVWVRVWLANGKTYQSPAIGFMGE